MQGNVHLLALDPRSGRLKGHPLPISAPGSSCSLQLRTLPGSSGLHVAVTDGTGVLFRAEVAAESDELVELALEWDERGRWFAMSPGRRVLTLPLEAANEPAPPLRLDHRAKQLDVALVVDGTIRTPAEGAAQSLLLADPQKWGAHAARMAALVETLAREMKAQPRTVVIAFGDQPLPKAGALDLRPAYQLFPREPEKRVLRPTKPEQIRDHLQSLPATSGGDFVDSLAEALEACRSLRWGQRARKLVIVTGDSPGYSLMAPAPAGGDAQARDRDVDTQVMALHRQGIELLTIYHAPPRGTEIAGSSVRPFLEHVREQYLSLASRPELFFEAADFDPAAAVRVLRNGVCFVGRGALPGIPTGSLRRRSRR